MDGLRGEYRNSVIEDLETVENWILNLENEASPESLGNARRILHSVKGSADSYEFPHATVICHSFEDFIEMHNLKNVDKELTNKLLAYNDLLKESFYLTDDPNLLNSSEQKLQALGLDKASTGFRVLLVENSKMILDNFNSILDKLGVSVHTSPDCYTALGRLIRFYHRG